MSVIIFASTCTNMNNIENDILSIVDRWLIGVTNIVFVATNGAQTTTHAGHI